MNRRSKPTIKRRQEKVRQITKNVRKFQVYQRKLSVILIAAQNPIILANRILNVKQEHVISTCYRITYRISLTEECNVLYA